MKKQQRECALLYLQIEADEIRTREGWTVDIRGITVHALVDVGLELIEHILYANSNLEYIGAMYGIICIRTSSGCS